VSDGAVPQPTTWPGAPQLQRGGLVVYPDPGKPAQSRVIAFQYNPETVTRSLQQQATEYDWQRNAGDTEHATLPLETLSMTVELDAADQPPSNSGADPDPIDEFGLHPALVALELLLYPSSQDLEKEWLQEQKGEAKVAPGSIPMVLLVWGRNRVLPVRLTSLSITEEGFDPTLNPIRARVELSVRSLTSRELRTAGRPWNQLVIDQVKVKEGMARREAANASAAGIEDVFALPPGGR
jgi:hypothetical protein